MNGISLMLAGFPGAAPGEGGGRELRSEWSNAREDDEECGAEYGVEEVGVEVAEVKLNEFIPEFRRPPVL